MEEMEIDYLCVAAHKGLYAPMSSGILLCRDKDRLPPLLFGGTGSYSRQPEQPPELPDRLECGTLSVPSIIGISAGLDFVNRVGRETIYNHEIKILQALYCGFSKCKGVHLYTSEPIKGRTAPVLSVNVDGYSSEELARELDRYGIAVRAGLHCAPMAHRHFGTIEDGTGHFGEPPAIAIVSSYFI